MARKLLLAFVGFATYGISKLLFSYVVLHAGGASLLGDIASLLALHTILALCLLQPIAATVSRFVPEYLARSHDGEAEALLTQGFVLSCIVSALVMGALLAFSGPMMALFDLSQPAVYYWLLPYVGAYGTYFFLKLTYYAYSRVGSYCIAEAGATLAFAGSLGLAVWWDTAGAYVLPWLVHAAVFVGFACYHLRQFIGGSRQLGRVDGLAGYARYGIAWLVSSAAGLGVYHLSILALGILGRDASAVGHYAFMLALLAPMTLLPTTLSMVLFPKLAAEFSCGREHDASGLVSTATRTLAVPLAVILIACLAFAPWILLSVGIPTSTEYALAFQLIALGLCVSSLSTPAGNLLAATKYVHVSAVIGALSVLAGAVVWGVAIGRVGVLGAGGGYGLAMCGRGIATMFAAQRRHPWWVRIGRRGWLMGVALIGAGCCGILPMGVGLRAVGGGLAFVCCGVAMHAELRILRAAGIRALQPTSWAPGT